MGNRFNTKVSATEPAAEDARAQHVKEIGEADYEAEVATSLPVVLDFYAKDSPACEALAPRFAAVSEKFSGRARFLRILRSGSAALSTRLGVTASPTIVFLVNGAERGERLTGDDIRRTDLKARVEALVGGKAVAGAPASDVAGERAAPPRTASPPASSSG